MEKLKRNIKRKIQTIVKPSKNRTYNNVFCVGWLKTGTTSCGRALQEFGFKHKGWDPKVRDWYKEGKIEKIIAHARYFESFDDLPWNYYDMIPVLDLAFPNSRYILLERDEESWFDSLQRFAVRNGMPKPNKEKAQTNFKYHNEFIKNYFLGNGNGKPEQLLVMNIFQGDSYNKLGRFLDVKEIPDEPFPHISP